MSFRSKYRKKLEKDIIPSISHLSKCGPGTTCFRINWVLIQVAHSCASRIRLPWG